MAIVTLTSKGQTTIPRSIRQYLGLHTGDKIEFLIEESGRVILTPLTTDVREVKSMLPKSKKSVSIKQMNKVIAKRGANL
jgi:AbrB family looped-hinge helix DNA binding protein